MTNKIVTVLIPARNEERDIERCIAAVAAQDYPAEHLEIIVVDGCSTDGTVERAERALAEIPFARTKVISNPTGDTPSNLNLGLTIAQGEIVCRVDARSLIPPHYVTTCVDVLTSRPGVVVVGGAQVATPPGRGPVATGIARALNNRWGMGLSRYRRGAASGPSDTVYLGAFRVADLRGARGWDERLPTNQDFELNRRLGQNGLVWFDSRLAVEYVPRDSLRRLWQQYRRFGRWKAATWFEGGVRIQPRQAVLVVAPAVAALATAVGVALRPRTTLASAVVLAAVVEAQSPGEASAAERACGLAASLVVAGGWWAGVVEQSVRYRRGEPLIASRR